MGAKGVVFYLFSFNCLPEFREIASGVEGSGRGTFFFGKFLEIEKFNFKPMSSEFCAEGFAYRLD